LIPVESRQYGKAKGAEPQIPGDHSLGPGSTLDSEIKGSGRSSLKPSLDVEFGPKHVLGYGASGSVSGGIPFLPRGAEAHPFGVDS
jgi:hypothetical protein